MDHQTPAVIAQAIRQTNPVASSAQTRRPVGQVLISSPLPSLAYGDRAYAADVKAW